MVNTKGLRNPIRTAIMTSMLGVALAERAMADQGLINKAADVEPRGDDAPPPPDPVAADVPRYGNGQPKSKADQRSIFAAEAKRQRKAEKRRRDAARE